MEKHRFTFVSVAVNDGLEIEADSRAEAFAKLVNEWCDNKINPLSDAVVRDYVMCDGGVDEFRQMLKEVDWENCELSIEDCSPKMFGLGYLSKLSKSRTAVYESNLIYRALREFEQKNKGLSEETIKALHSFAWRIDRWL